MTTSGLCSIPAFPKVRRWTVVVNIPDAAFEKPFGSLTAFCRAICSSRAQALEVAIIPVGVIEGSIGSDFLPLEFALQPLELLRGVETFTLRDANHFEIPDTMRQDEDSLVYTSHLEEKAVLQVDLMTSVQSTNPLELLFKMSSSLRAYAQAFEICEYFREEMFLEEDEFSRIRPALILGRDRFNPFRGKFMHPVEKALLHAMSDAEKEDSESFKEQRSVILEYLEPQYQKMCQAAENVVWLIKSQKQYYGLFHAGTTGEPSSEEKVDKHISALVLLAQYAATFHRDYPFEIKTQIRNYQHVFNDMYAVKECNVSLSRLGALVDSGNFRTFTEDFRATCDAFDAQFLSIVKARKLLFKYDGLDRSSWVIDPELSRCDEPVKREVDEPNITVESNYNNHYDESYLGGISNDEPENNGSQGNGDEGQDGDDCGSDQDGHSDGRSDQARQ